MRREDHIAELLTALRACLRSRRLERRLRDRAAIEAYQARALKALTQHLTATLPFYKGLPPDDFRALPVIDKQTLLDNFADMNAPGLTLDEVRTALANGASEIDGHGIGHSTGTSGNRGYYVISNREHFVWLGTILAKALPRAFWRAQRVALCLPGRSTLYGSASRGSRIQLRFFDLSDGIAAWEAELAEYAPDTIVAPPKVLRHLAEAGTLTARHIFSGAEVLDPLDRDLIEAATGRTVRQIYMATEGLFGVSCEHGTLHLAEDVVHFEWESVPGSSLVAPIVTDFTRRTQAMARYRMNDLLELSEEPCPCGSAFQAVRRIEGRSDDVFRLPGQDGSLRMVTPDVLRNRLIDISADITDFRIIQTGRETVEIHLSPDIVSRLSELVVSRFTDFFAGMGLGNIEITVHGGLSVPHDRKLRRVRREWSP